MGSLYLNTTHCKDLAPDMFRGNRLESPYNTYIKWTRMILCSVQAIKTVEFTYKPERRIPAWRSMGLI